LFWELSGLEEEGRVEYGRLLLFYSFSFDGIIYSQNKPDVVVKHIKSYNFDNI
jgi:hypothetical protein